MVVVGVVGVLVDVVEVCVLVECVVVVCGVVRVVEWTVPPVLAGADDDELLLELPPLQAAIPSAAASHVAAVAV